jgi:D-sedoheptulose 7-phosphate isomerase
MSLSEQPDRYDQSCASALEHLQVSASVTRATAERCSGSIVNVANLIVSCFQAGHKLLICGNGGSAADAQHMAAEFVNRLSKDFERPGLPAISLTTDTSFLTSYANDYGYEGVFERQLRALGQKGDVLIGISTSGNSGNVIRALAAARESGIQTIGLIGEGGQMTSIVDQAVVVPVVTLSTFRKRYWRSNTLFVYWLSKPSSIAQRPNAVHRSFGQPGNGCA